MSYEKQRGNRAFSPTQRRFCLSRVFVGELYGSFSGLKEPSPDRVPAQGTIKKARPPHHSGLTQGGKQHEPEPDKELGNALAWHLAHRDGPAGGFIGR